MKKIIFFLLNTFYLMLSPTFVEATTMSNNNYILQMGQFNTVSGSSQDNKQKITIGIGDFTSTVLGGENLRVRNGFQSVTSDSFTFGISGNDIDFGPLSATNPVTRTNILTISNAKEYNYTVLAFENHPLMSEKSQVLIPDTTCDNGLCNENLSSPWTNILTYGFGYRCNNIVGNDCVNSFLDPNAYRQFADNSKKESGQIVLKGNGKIPTKQTEIVYKVNISSAQPAGVFTNTITFIASPNF